MRAKYPNLELIEYKCKIYAYRCYGYLLERIIYPTFEIVSFKQTWPNTGTGFDFKNWASGQAFTEEYTTVCKMEWHENNDKNKFVKSEHEIFGVMEWNENNDKNKVVKSDHEIFGVFFGNRLAYMCADPGKEFYDDLDKREMPSQKEAAAKYDGYINSTYEEFV